MIIEYNLGLPAKPYPNVIKRQTKKDPSVSYSSWRRPHFHHIWFFGDAHFSCKQLNLNIMISYEWSANPHMIVYCANTQE